MIKKATCFLLLMLLSFNIRVASLFADTLTAGESLSVTATVGGAVTPPPPTGPFGDGGAQIVMPATSVRFSGAAYPGAVVTLLKNGAYATSVTADKDGFFDITLQEKYNGTILYSLEATDLSGEKSLLINYPLVVTSGYLTYLSGINFPPTINLDKIQVSEGNFLTVNGYALPNKTLQIVIQDQNQETSKTFTLTSSDTGDYDITLPLINLPLGNYSVYVKYPDDSRISKLVRFIVGDSDISSINSTLNLPGDCNADGQINLVDFSVLAFWYKKPNPPSCVDINRDGIVNLTDFSILAFYWTD